MNSSIVDLENPLALNLNNLNSKSNNNIDGLIQELDSSRTPKINQNRRPSNNFGNHSSRNFPMTNSHSQKQQNRIHNTLTLDVAHNQLNHVLDDEIPESLFSQRIPIDNQTKTRFKRKQFTMDGTDPKDFTAEEGSEGSSESFNNKKKDKIDQL